MEKLIKSWKQNYALFFIIGILVYFSIAFGQSPNPDTLGNGVYYKHFFHNGFAWENELGRYGLGAFASLKSFTNNPALVTFSSLLIISVIIMMICSMFGITEIWRFFTGFFLLVNPHVVNTLTYYYCSDAYFFAYLLCVSAVFLCSRFENRFIPILSAIFIACSLSLYQAYLSVAIVLTLLVIMQRVLDGHTSRKSILCFIAKMVFAGAAGVLLYMLGNKLLGPVLNFSVENGRFKSLSVIDIRSMAYRFINSYQHYINYLFNDRIILNSWMRRDLLNTLIAALCLLLIAIKTVRNKRMDWFSLATLICIVAAFPPAVMAMTILSAEIGVYSQTAMLIVPTLNYIYLIIPILLVGESFKGHGRVFKGASIVLSGVLCWIMLLFTSIFQSYMTIQFNRSTTLAASILNDVNDVENKEDYFVVIGGDVSKEPEQMKRILEGTVSVYGLSWTGPNGKTESWKAIYDEFFWLRPNIAPKERYLEIINSEAYRALPLYEETGKPQIIEDCIVFKLSS